MDIAAQKHQLRAEMKAVRTRLNAENPDAANLIAANAPEILLKTPAKVIASYLPIGSEIDPSILAQKLTCDGKTLCLPRLDQDAEKLEFFAWNFGDPIEEGPFSLIQPSGLSKQVHPTLLLVPLLAFDRRGARLGYGKGYYDRAIGKLQTRIFLCGVGFANQEVPTVPTEQHDRKLDWVVTDKEAICMSRQ